MASIWICLEDALEYRRTSRLTGGVLRSDLSHWIFSHIYTTEKKINVITMKSFFRDVTQTKLTGMESSSYGHFDRWRAALVIEINGRLEKIYVKILSESHVWAVICNSPPFKLSTYRIKISPQIQFKGDRLISIVELCGVVADYSLECRNIRCRDFARKSQQIARFYTVCYFISRGGILVILSPCPECKWETVRADISGISSVVSCCI